MRNVPKLRFKEFTDELREVKFKDFLNERKNIATDNEELYSLTIEKGVTPKEERYEREFLVNNEKEAYKIVLKNDFVYNPMNIRFGAVAQFIENKNVKVSKYYNIFYCNNCINSYFFEKFIKTKRMFDLYNKLATGSLNEKKRLHFTDFLEIKQPFPSLEEQEKIGDFLLNVDKKISITEEKLSLFEEYKKGIMQKIFNQELRFKDSEGNDYPEWEEKEVRNLVKDKIIEKPLDGNHGSLHPTSSDYVLSGIPFIMANDINKNSIDLKECKKISKEQAKTLQKGFSKEGDILLTHKGSIGRTCIVPKLETDYIILTPQVTYYRILNNRILINKYLKSYFESPNFVKILEVISSSGTRPYIGITEQLELKIQLPCLEEQEKIANFLSSIDNKIDNLTSELEDLKEFKKGLLQQMFV